ncbi:hypothetical protein Ahy_B08g094314 [Arachis hypogaea]|uniref:Pentatricopeptide repeat-containing protein n=1 Tax=Arachis hypogaea TaxID=3818 RepID=A0A444Y8S9_ARAHY|nr:hypothetical protein Ahy_B08g094314 [Arachis hypogaea]
MYGRNFGVEDARKLFDELLEPDTVCWTSVISALTRNDRFKDAVELFYKIHRGCGLAPDGFTFGTLLAACGNLGWWRQGREVHAKVVTSGICGNVVVESSLLDMYEYETVLNLVKESGIVDIYSLGTIARDSLLRDRGMRFISYTGLVNEGREYFTSMTKKYEIQPGVEHYNCMIDLLGRAELIEEAEILLENSDCRHDQSLWVVLLGACTRCSDYITAERIAKKMIELQPGFHLSYVLLGNI